MQAGAQAYLGYIYALQGKLEQARLRAAQIAYELPDAQMAHHLLDSLIALIDQNDAMAEASLRQALAAQQHLRHSLLMTDARLGLASFYLIRNRPQAALAELGPALADLEQRGLPGIVLQEGRSVLPLLRLALEHDLHQHFVGHP